MLIGQFHANMVFTCTHKSRKINSIRFADNFEEFLTKNKLVVNIVAKEILLGYYKGED